MYLDLLLVPAILFVGLEIGGEMNMTSGIQVAQLALKHRQNKKQNQRIIVFAGRCDFFFISCLNASPYYKHPIT